MPPLRYCLFSQKRIELSPCVFAKELSSKFLENRVYSQSKCFTKENKTNLKENTNKSYEIYQSKYGESGFFLIIDLQNDTNFMNSFPNMTEFIAFGTYGFTLRLNYLISSAGLVITLRYDVRIIYPSYDGNFVISYLKFNKNQ